MPISQQAIRYRVLSGGASAYWGRVDEQRATRGPVFLATRGDVVVLPSCGSDRCQLPTRRQWLLDAAPSGLVKSEINTSSSTPSLLPRKISWSGSWKPTLRN